MEYLSGKFRKFTNYFVRRVEENQEKKGSKYDVYFEQVYKVLSWEDNTYTLAVLLIFHLLFWLVVQWQIRFLGLLFSTVLIIFLWDTYAETRDVSLYRGKYSDVFEEIRACTHDFVLNLRALRKESPSSFCLGMSLVFLFISFMAKNMSGYVLVYLTTLATFFVPLCVKLLPADQKESLKQVLRSLGNTRGVLAEEELIPFLSNDFGNKDNDLDSLLTDKTADSQSNSLASGLSTMPSYLDVADIQADIEEEDLIPSKGSQSGVSYTPGELSSDSDSDPRDIHFEPAHFNADSSSEDEKLFGSGMRFSSDFVDASQGKQNTHTGGLGGVLSNFAVAGSNFVASALISTIKPAPLERKISSSSSESEFEIIDSDDVKE